MYHDINIFRNKRYYITAGQLKQNTFSNTFLTLLKKGANLFCTQS